MLDRIAINGLLIVAVLIGLSAPASPSAYPGRSNSQNPSSTIENKAKQHYLAAKEALANGDLDSALNELNAAAALAPGNAVIWYNVAVVESKKNNPDAAMQHLRKAIRLGLPSDLKDQALELQSSLKSTIVQKGSPGAEHQITGTAATDPSLRYFVGSWVSTVESDRPSTNRSCYGTHITDRRRLVVQPADGPNKLSVKLTIYENGLSKDSGCAFSSSGKLTYGLIEHYLGSIYKEGSDFRMAIDDGTCTGDCAGDDTTGATYTLEMDSPDKMVRVHKTDNERVTFDRE
jgi:tetratricopeptide (TPR) repeat protein